MILGKSLNFLYTINEKIDDQHFCGNCKQYNGRKNYGAHGSTK